MKLNATTAIYERGRELLLNFDPFQMFMRAWGGVGGVGGVGEVKQDD